MHKLSFGGLLLSLVVLSGCTLTPPKIGNGGNTTGQDPFQANALPGTIWRSSDGGKTFEPKITVDEKRKITSAEVLDVSFLLRDPSGDLNPSKAPSVFVATIDNGIFKSDDSGEVWQPRDFPPQKVYRFVADSVNPDRMFATGVVASRGKIFRTKDGGTTWEDVYTEPGTGTVLVSLAQDPRSTETIFAGTSTGTVIRSTDGGDTWRNIGTSIDGPITEIVFDAGVANRLYALAFESKLYRSDDNGLTWLSPLQTSYNTPTTPSETVSTVNPSGMVSLIADPYLSGVLYMGTKAGIVRSQDAGETWTKLNIIESAEKFPIRAFAVNPKNSKELIFASGRTFYRSTNTGETWSVVPLNVDRDISVLAYDPFDPSIIYLGLRKYK